MNSRGDQLRPWSRGRDCWLVFTSGTVQRADSQPHVAERAVDYAVVAIRFAYATIESMILPQFSLRWLLAVTTLCAVFFFVVHRAIGGSHWALVLTYAVASLLIVMAVHALMFFGVWLFSLALGLRTRRATIVAGSPFRLEPTSPGPRSATTMD